MLLLAVDANFKLKQKKKQDNQLELGMGWSYFVEEGGYQSFLKDYLEEPEVRLHKPFLIRIANAV